MFVFLIDISATYTFRHMYMHVQIIVLVMTSEATTRIDMYLWEALAHDSRTSLETTNTIKEETKKTKIQNITVNYLEAKK